jgi:hypothetical protein
MPKFMTIVRGSENHAPPPAALFDAIDKLLSPSFVAPGAADARSCVAMGSQY